MRTAGAMAGTQLWLCLAALHGVLLSVNCGHHHRRSMPTPTTLPVSKGGWRPVLSSGILPGYGAFAAAPLHQAYRFPVQVADNYPSSSRPLAARDATKLTSIAQSYRPTTLRSLPASSPSLPPSNQPINSYLNPFALSNGLSHYKIVQNFPGENVVIRNPHNPYAARPVFSKYPNKFKQPYHNAVMQQLNNVQPLQFGIPSYPPTSKPLDVFGKPVEMYVRPADAKRPSGSGGTEIYKPEVFKVPSDSDTAPQSVSQQHVKTAQQQQAAPPTKQQQHQQQQHQQQQQQQQQQQHQQQQQQQHQQQKQYHQQQQQLQQQHQLQQQQAINGFPQYQFKDQLPPSILGTFSSFGVQSMKGRDPVFQPTKTTYLPPHQAQKQTIFNSFSYSPFFKSTPAHFPATTPKFQTTLNQIHFGTTLGDYKAPTAQPSKAPLAIKGDPNTPQKGISFKPSPQDPFAKPGSTYNPNLQTTTASNAYYISNYDPRLPLSPHNIPPNNYYNQPSFSYETKKQKIHDSIPSSQQIVNQKPIQQLSEKPKKTEIESTQLPVPAPATYEVTETYENDDVITDPNAWSAIPATHDINKPRPGSEEYVVKDGRPTSPSELPEEYAIVTEADKGYENSLNYDGNVENQSRRPVGDDFEPIGKHKLKDYYYKVSTPTQEDYSSHYKRHRKPEGTTPSYILEDTTQYKNNDIEALPTLPPNKHFKRPNGQEPIDKDKIRKRNKNRRRRPPLANRERQESSSTSTTEAYYQTTESENYTIKPRLRVTKPKSDINLTTPTISTDLSTSALPTISPTSPTIVKKKIGQRRPVQTTTDRLEVTTLSYRDYELSKDSPIMKVGTRSQYPRVTTATYDYKPTETPDYTHKQDEKDTPTSDIAVSLPDTLRSRPDQTKQFSFHKDVKPLEAKLEPVRGTTVETTRSIDDVSEFTTTTPRSNSENGKISRPRLKNKYDNNRPKFSVKDYRNRLSSTTTTDKPAESAAPKLRFPQRRLPFDKFNNDNETIERKKFMPKEPRHKSNSSDDPLAVKELVHSTRQPNRQRSTYTTESAEPTQKISSRIRNSSRRPRPTEEPETSSPTTVHIKRPLRKKVKDSELGESVQDVTVSETTAHYDHRDDTTTSERTRSESAIMKIAKDDKKHTTDHVDHIFEHSKRVSDLTLAASKDYNTPGMFKTVSPNSRRIPNYFTIATDDPILPIEAFFPQLNQKKES